MKNRMTVRELMWVLCDLVSKGHGNKVVAMEHPLDGWRIEANIVSCEKPAISEEEKAVIFFGDEGL